MPHVKSWRNSIAASNTSTLSVDAYVAGVLAGQRSILARAITLIESRAGAHQDKAEQLLQRVLHKTGKSMRVGITGVPGVGKSTFIEALGCLLCDRGRRVAVLTVDPSSALSGGSILGDKTRMEHLSRRDNAFIRPSAAGETLGGVASKTREALYLCEAAGFDVILVETVGVGQSEIAVRSMVDFFLLMLLPGGGDELQGIKKGIAELADAMFINKADGPSKELAEITRREYSSAVRTLHPATRGWASAVYSGSARTGEGLQEIWTVVERFFDVLGKSGFIEQRRRDQSRAWLHERIREALSTRFFHDAAMKVEMEKTEHALANNDISVATAVKQLLEYFDKRRQGDDSKD